MKARKYFSIKPVSIKHLLFGLLMTKNIFSTKRSSIIFIILFTSLISQATSSSLLIKLYSPEEGHVAEVFYYIFNRSPSRNPKTQLLWNKVNDSYYEESQRTLGEVLSGNFSVPLNEMRDSILDTKALTGNLFKYNDASTMHLGTKIIRKNPNTSTDTYTPVIASLDFFYILGESNNGDIFSEIRIVTSPIRDLSDPKATRLVNAGYDIGIAGGHQDGIATNTIKKIFDATVRTHRVSSGNLPIFTMVTNYDGKRKKSQKFVQNVVFHEYVNTTLTLDEVLGQQKAILHQVMLHID